MQRLIDADAVEKVLEEKHFRRVLDSDRWLIADIRKSIMDLPTIDAIPIEFIQKRINQLKEMNGRIFIANGGYTSPSDYEQWELERLVREWRDENDTAD